MTRGYLHWRMNIFPYFTHVKQIARAKLYCPYCGACYTSREATFCPNCGKKLPRARARSDGKIRNMDEVIDELKELWKKHQS